jgi:integrase
VRALDFYSTLGDSSMHAYSTWNIDASQILSRRELDTVLRDLKRRATRLPNVQMNLAILRLACCCGLRASEIGGLRLGDVRVDVGRPHLLIRAEHAKLMRPRRIPLWWDAGTLADLTAWRNYRHAQGAKRGDPFICSLRHATMGDHLNRHVLRRRFHTACRVLGWDRLRTLTIHHGRHTFISHALAGGRSLAEVKAAAGHASLLTTSVYLHVVVDEPEELGSLFAPTYTVD